MGGRGDQGEHNDSENAETNSFSSCHHRIACLRRRCPGGHGWFRRPNLVGILLSREKPRKCRVLILTINLLYEHIRIPDSEFPMTIPETARVCSNTVIGFPGFVKPVAPHGPLIGA
jgi:hypothetical protein